MPRKRDRVKRKRRFYFGSTGDHDMNIREINVQFFRSLAAHVDR